MSTPTKPLPLPDEVTAPYWEAARSGRLSIQFCRGCASFVHLPADRCPRCTGTDLDWRDISGHGRLYSYTTMHDSPGPGFADALPYIVAVVELDEQPGLLVTTNLAGTDPDTLRIGLPVEVAFENLDPDTAVPQFRVRTSSERNGE